MAKPKLKIKVADLKKICQKLFEHLEELNIDSVPLNEDYYWSIDKSEKYKIEDPKDLDRGQLSDDLKDVQDMLEGKYEPLVNNFLDVATLLTYIGEIGEVEIEKCSSSKKSK